MSPLLIIATAYMYECCHCIVIVCNCTGSVLLLCENVVENVTAFCSYSTIPQLAILMLLKLIMGKSSYVAINVIKCYCFMCKSHCQCA